MSSTTPGKAPYYFVPGPSRHPVFAAFGLFFVILGAEQWINDAAWGAYSLAFGLTFWAVVIFQWFRDAVAESESGLYGRKIDLSYRWSMSWFIFSEVMFFGAFFTALWWRAATRCPPWATSKTLCSGLTSMRCGPACRQVLPAHQPIWSSRFRQWGHSGCPPSTPRCCSPRVSRLPSPTMPCRWESAPRPLPSCG